MRMIYRLVTTLLLCACVTSLQAKDDLLNSDAAKIEFRWGVKIPMRDGVRLNATVYTPKAPQSPAPCIFTLTPYIAQSFHDRGVYFAARGLPFLTVDARGRGNSQGVFRPFIQEALDGHDVVEWLAKQPYCNGKVATWGGSYGGYAQWSLAKEQPPHLATMVPVASAYPGLDYPMFANIASPHMMKWLTLTGGSAGQDKIFADRAFWSARFREWFESGRPLSDFDQMIGSPSVTFQEWLRHPHPDAYWDAHVPDAQQYGKLQLPILTITGSYDADQPGALAFYRNHMRHGNEQARQAHHLVIGPWDHPGTRTPRARFGGLSFAEASLVNLPELHVQWYDWTMRGGQKPEFLKDRVAYYVMGAEKWRYSPTLEAVTKRTDVLYLDARTNPTDVLHSGMLQAVRGSGGPDEYVYDPRDTGLAELQSAESDIGEHVDQRLIYAERGKHLVYHSAPFERATQISGFLKLSAWIAIDQPDTDFSVCVYEVKEDGSSILLSEDRMRARYRESPRVPKLIETKKPLRYDFEGFRFVSREIAKRSRLRLVLAPVNSIYTQKNYNSGGVVADESIEDARTVTVKLFHSGEYQSALHIPIGHPD